MSDQEILDLLAEQAPTPRPGYVDDVLAKARRTRRVQRVTTWSAGLGVAAVAAVGVAIIAPNLSGGQQSPAASSGPATASPSAEATSSAKVPDEVGAYAIALRAVAEQVTLDKPGWPVVYILDHSCANVVHPGPGIGDCDPRALSAEVRDGLTRALADFAPVTFIADSAEVAGSVKQIKNGGLLVTLGHLRIKGDTAELAVAAVAGGTNGRGMSFQLAREGDTWRVTGNAGPNWIS